MTFKTYDPKCYELALHFVRDEARRQHWNAERIERTTQLLAIDIQQAIEDFFA